MSADQLIALVSSLAWPILAFIVLILFRKQVERILAMVERRVEAGAAIKIYSLEVGQAPSNLPSAANDAAITGDFLALVHSSWRYPRKDAEFGTRMWAFHVIVEARPNVLDRIESAKYFLDPSYPNPVQLVTDRASKFKLKELANGESTVRAEIKIIGQSNVIHLTRYINLTETGPRI